MSEILSNEEIDSLLDSLESTPSPEEKAKDKREKIFKLASIATSKEQRDVIFDTNLSALGVPKKEILEIQKVADDNAPLPSLKDISAKTAEKPVLTKTSDEPSIDGTSETPEEEDDDELISQEDINKLLKKTPGDSVSNSVKDIPQADGTDTKSEFPPLKIALAAQDAKKNGPKEIQGLLAEMKEKEIDTPTPENGSVSLLDGEGPLISADDINALLRDADDNAPLPSFKDISAETAEKPVLTKTSDEPSIDGTSAAEEEQEEALFSQDEISRLLRDAPGDSVKDVPQEDGTNTITQAEFPPLNIALAAQDAKKNGPKEIQGLLAEMKEKKIDTPTPENGSVSLLDDEDLLISEDDINTLLRDAPNNDSATPEEVDMVFMNDAEKRKFLSAAFPGNYKKLSVNKKRALIDGLEITNTGTKDKNSAIIRVKDTPNYFVKSIDAADKTFLTKQAQALFLKAGYDETVMDSYIKTDISSNLLKKLVSETKPKNNALEKIKAAKNKLLSPLGQKSANEPEAETTGPTLGDQQFNNSVPPTKPETETTGPTLGDQRTPDVETPRNKEKLSTTVGSGALAAGKLAKKIAHAPFAPIHLKSKVGRRIGNTISKTAQGAVKIGSTMAVGAVINTGIRAAFGVAATAACLPITGIFAGGALAMVAGGLTSIAVTRIMNKKATQKKNWKKRAFFFGAVFGAVGFGVMEYLSSTGSLDTISDSLAVDTNNASGDGTAAADAGTTGGDIPTPTHDQLGFKSPLISEDLAKQLSEAKTPEQIGHLCKEESFKLFNCDTFEAGREIPSRFAAGQELLDHGIKAMQEAGINPADNDTLNQMLRDRIYLNQTSLDGSAVDHIAAAADKTILANNGLDAQGNVKVTAAAVNVDAPANVVVDASAADVNVDATETASPFTSDLITDTVREQLANAKTPEDTLRICENQIGKTSGVIHSAEQAAANLELLNHGIDSAQDIKLTPEATVRLERMHAYRAYADFNRLDGTPVDVGQTIIDAILGGDKLSNYGEKILSSFGLDADGNTLPTAGQTISIDPKNAAQTGNHTIYGSTQGGSTLDTSDHFDPIKKGWEKISDILSTSDTPEPARPTTANSGQNTNATYNIS